MLGSIDSLLTKAHQAKVVLRAENRIVDGDWPEDSIPRVGAV